MFITTGFWKLLHVMSQWSNPQGRSFPAYYQFAIQVLQILIKCFWGEQIRQNLIKGGQIRQRIWAEGDQIRCYTGLVPEWILIAICMKQGGERLGEERKGSLLLNVWWRYKGALILRAAQFKCLSRPFFRFQH